MLQFQQDKCKVGYIMKKHWYSKSIPKFIITPKSIEMPRLSINYVNNYQKFCKNWCQERDLLYIQINPRITKIKQELIIQDIIENNRGLWNEETKAPNMFKKLLKSQGVYLINFDGLKWEDLYFKLVVKKNKFRYHCITTEKHYNTLNQERIYFYKNCTTWMIQKLIIPYTKLTLDNGMDSVIYFFYKNILYIFIITLTFFIKNI